MGNPQILLFDLDGTLLRNDKSFSTLEILSKCKGCVYFIGISTSRGEQNCLGFLRKMKPDILISSGGALVRVNEKIICSSSFRQLQKIEELFEKDCSGHDYWHSLRVLNNAEKMAKTEKCDKYIVMIAALLNDTDDIYNEWNG